MRLVDPILAEFEQESAATRRVLAAVPADRLAWKPHPRSMSAGELAWHIATTPGFVATNVWAEEFDFALGPPPPPAPSSKDEILAAFEKNLGEVKKSLGDMDDKAAGVTWTLKNGAKVAFSMPRIAFLRMVLLNHGYHHRGQLTVYLRQLEAKVPSVYGPSADENPFA